MLRLSAGTDLRRVTDVTTSPSMRTVPAVGASSPAIHRRVVVLPQPDGPNRVRILPRSTPNVTPSTASSPSKLFSRPSTPSVADQSEAVRRDRFLANFELKVDLG